MRAMRVIFCLLLLPAIAVAQSDPVDQYMKAELERRRIPGAALLVIQRGETVKMQGYGFANIELEVPVTPDSVFELASVTKQFTATAIMLLVEEGRVRLDERISAYLPDTPGAWSGITVRHLLTHTAGLASLATGFASLWSGGARFNYTTAEMYQSAMRDPVGSAPGERYEYSDVGYFLLGMIIEKASGRRYREFLAERFFKPLGMSSSSVIDQLAIVKSRAAGYTLYRGQLVHIRRHWNFEMASHYGVLSNVRDLARWEAALAAGKVVKSSSLEQMWTPVTLRDGSSYPYGFGWQVDEKRGHRWISHTGITGTEYSRYPDDQVVVIVLTNLGLWPSSGDSVAPWGLTHGVAGRYVEGMLVSALPEQPDPDPQLSQKLREMMASLAQGADEPMVSPRLRSLITPATRKLLGARISALKSFTFIACDQVGAREVVRLGERVSRACYYRMLTGSETRYYTFWLTADGRVAEFNSALD